MSVALRQYLQPIRAILANPDVNEIMINRPNQYIIETPAGKQIVETADFSLGDLQALATLVASHTRQKISEKNPLLSGNLPDGERVQIVMPPAAHAGMFGVAIRKPTVLALTLEDYAAAGAFADVATENTAGITAVDKDLLALKKAGEVKDFLRLAVESRKNILISGGTSSGKSTFANTLIKSMPLETRIITIEDVQETRIDQADRLHLIFSKGGQGVSGVTAKALLEASLRLNPDRILLSELRGEEAFFYLRAINSGHPGSITTLHADSVAGAFDQLVMMVNQAGVSLTEANIRRYLHQVIDVVVQFTNRNGRRVMTALHFDPFLQQG